MVAERVDSGKVEQTSGEYKIYINRRCDLIFILYSRAFT